MSAGRITMKLLRGGHKEIVAVATAEQLHAAARRADELAERTGVELLQTVGVAPLERFGTLRARLSWLREFAWAAQAAARDLIGGSR